VSPTTLPLILRLALLALFGCLLEISTVSQITIFGARADLMPLVIAATGLLCGSLSGAIFGFGCGLFIDTALVQTLGLSSLVYVVAGYGAGRLRELRDPQAAATPLVVGAVATTIVTAGYGLMQFLLGVDTPVSWLLLGEILLTIAVNTLLALPVYAMVRRWLLPVLPEDPRRRRRRAYTTGGLSPLSRA
jgi:rod shape-determining protein MreD